MNIDETDYITRVILSHDENGWVVSYVRKSRWMTGRPAYLSKRIKTGVYQDEEQARSLAQLMADTHGVELEEE